MHGVVRKGYGKSFPTPVNFEGGSMDAKGGAMLCSYGHCHEPIREGEKFVHFHSNGVDYYFHNDNEYGADTCYRRWLDEKDK
jgi:hypothetical protein